ncbi:MAG: hypothetical protein ACU84H_15050 [Gammaproteobacteria bacterium]
MQFYAINLAIFTLLFFIIGMIKPKWVLFFLEKPTRIMILMITPFLIMITVTLYGEGVRREKAEKALLTIPPIKETPAPAPVPVPEPAPETPASKE